ncbi:MAG: OmpA family protein [Tannerellaceae bacterium]|nr:OmpA family protein [Tannerellaceae bacterium]
MKTKILTFALLACFVFDASAQELQPQVGFSNEKGAKVNFKKNKAGDNWFVSIAGGASMLMGDDNAKADLGKRININPQLAVGKWFMPYWGVRLQFTGGPLVGWDTGFKSPQYNLQNAYSGLHKQSFTFYGAHLDFLLDVTNLWAPYNEKKLFRLIPWLGLGYAQRLKFEDYSRTETPTANAGILTAFRLSKRVDLNVELQGIMTNEDFNRVYAYHLTDFIAQGTVGLTFKLGKTDFEVIEPTDYALLNDLNSQINSLRRQNEELSKRPASCPECPKVQPVTQISNYAENVVFFRLNSSKIDANQEINIYNTAQFMKDKNMPVTVIGFADKKTGSSSYNKSLSEKRARAVAKQLIEKYGISSNQISIQWKGSEEQPYSINNWNRVVIMTADKK